MDIMMPPRRFPVPRGRGRLRIAYGFLIASLLVLLQLKYQNKDVSPFDTHPTNMAAFLVTVCAYPAALVAKLMASQTRWARYSAIFDCIADLSAALSTVPLVTVFLPNTISCILMFLIWVLMVLWAGRKLLWDFCLGLHNRLAVVVDRLIDMLPGIVAPAPEEHPDAPV